MFKILQSYLTTAYLLKLAKLNDEQYLQVFKAPKLKKKLEDADLLNEFYQALPEQSEADLNGIIQIYKKEREQVKQKEVKNQQILNFLNKYGDKYFENKLVRYFPIYLQRQEEYTEAVIFNVESYFIRKIKDVIYDYIQTPNMAEFALKEFISAYENFISLPDKNNMELACKMLYILVSYIYAAEDTYDINFQKYEKALNLRNSDKFDFVVNEMANQSIKRNDGIQSTEEGMPTKPDIKIDYSDEATTKNNK